MSKRILIAEDSSVIQTLTKKILGQLHFEVQTVKNGEEVIDIIKHQQFDLIFMDINMPVMDGMECTRKIRSMSDSSKSDIPIVAITGNAKNYSHNDFMDAGVSYVLQKPLDFDNLVEVALKYTSQ